MTQIDTFIIDDEPDAGKLLKNLLKDFPAIRVKDVFSDARIALDLIIMEQTPLLFLDIEMPEISGIEFLKQINKYAPNTKVIFVTAFKKYELDAIQNNAFGFITKPIDKTELQHVVYKITKDAKQKI